MFRFIVVLFLTLFSLAVAQLPCDEVHASLCPEYSGLEALECLKNQPDLTPDCSSYISLHEICKDDINSHCTGLEFSGDLIVCLREWTPSSNLSPACLEALPKKEEKKKVMSKQQKEKANKRRKNRRNAARIAREF